MSVRNGLRSRWIGALLGLCILASLPSPALADPLYTAELGSVIPGSPTDPDPGRNLGSYYDDNGALHQGFRGDAGGYTTGNLPSGSFSDPATYTQTAFLY